MLVPSHIGLGTCINGTALYGNRGCRSGGSLPEPGAVACLRARLEDAFLFLPASEFLSIARRFSGDEGYRRDEVSRLPRDARPHALFTLVQPRTRAGKLASAAGPRAVPHIQPNVDPPSSKRGSAIQRSEEPPHVYYQEEASEKLYQQSTTTTRYSSKSRKKAQPITPTLTSYRKHVIHRCCNYDGSPGLDQRRDTSIDRGIGQIQDSCGFRMVVLQP